MVALLGFDRRDVADRLQQPAIVETVDPFQRRELDGFERPPRPTSKDDLGLEETVGRNLPFPFDPKGLAKRRESRPFRFTECNGISERTPAGRNVRLTQLRDHIPTLKRLLRQLG